MKTNNNYTLTKLPKYGIGQEIITQTQDKPQDKPDKPDKPQDKPDKPDKPQDKPDKPDKPQDKPDKPDKPIKPIKPNKTK